MTGDERNKMIAKIMKRIYEAVDGAIYIFIEEVVSNHLDDLTPEDLQRTYRRVCPNE